MKHKLPFLALLAFSLAIFLFFFHSALLHPGKYLFAGSGDGLKNYYTYYYHIKHDTSCTGFAGMNYPYGEHFLYTDCHPLLAGLFKVIAPVFPFFSDQAIGILNFLMLISVFLTFLVVYALLRESGISRWLSAGWSLGITLLAPQVWRLGGHLALSYSIAIPLSWLIMIRFDKAEKKLPWVLLQALLNLAWLFIHSYLGMIVIFFQGTYLLLNLITSRKYRTTLLNYINLAATIIMPLLLFYLFAKLTDTHAGRTDNPSGFFLYNAEPDDVFLPSRPPLRPFLDRLFGPVIRLQWEAWSYVGLVPGLITFTLIIIFLVRLVRRKKNYFLADVFRNRRLNLALIAGFIVLLFAMGLPFKLFPSLIDLFPVIKQFRATGRFAWVFFFTATVFAGFTLQRIFDLMESSGKKVSGLILLAAACIVQVAEGIPYFRETSVSITRTPNLFRKEFLPKNFTEALTRIVPSGYQAIFPLPFFYQGSESFSRPRNEATVSASILLSAYTGLPMLGANLTRTSIPESRKIVQVVSPSWYPKEIRADLRDDRPFLVIRTSDPITAYEQEILDRAVLVYQGDGISLYSLSKDDLFRNDAGKIFAWYAKNHATLTVKGGFLATDPRAFVYYQSWDERPSEHAFRGNGAFSGIKKGKNTYAEFAPGTFRPGRNYSVSLWMYNGAQDALNLWFRFMVEEYDTRTDSWYVTTVFPDNSEVIFGDWSLVEAGFTVHDTTNGVSIVSIGKQDSKAPLFADDLLVRESSDTVVKLNPDGSLFFNNQEIRLPQGK